MVNITLWSVVGLVLGFAIYYTLFVKGKKICKITVFEISGDVLIKHQKTYFGIEKFAYNETKTKKIKWLRITDLKCDWVLPPNKNYIHSNKGLKHLYLIWHGGNHFEPLPFNQKRFSYVRIKTKTGEYYKKIPTKKYELSVTDDDLDFTVAGLQDTLQSVYQIKKSLLEKLQPYYALGIIVLVAIAAMYITGKQNTEASEKNSLTAQFLVDAIEGVSTTKIDDNTIIEKDLTNKKKGEP